jgi:hypothetical protein
LRQKSTLHITSLEETACGVVFVTHPLNTWVSDLCVSVENFFGYFCYDLMYNYLSVWPYILTNIIFFQRYIYIYRISLSAYQYKYKIWPTMLNLSLDPSPTWEYERWYILRDLYFGRVNSSSFTSKNPGWTEVLWKCKQLLLH